MEHLKVQVWIFHRGTQPGSPAAPLRVLLLKLTDARGGFWQPVTGGVEEGETLAAAALREASEESGLSFAGAPLDLGFQFAYDGKGARAGARFHESCFGLEVAASPSVVRLDPREHVEARWVEPSDARALLHFDSNVAGLDALLRKIAPQA